MAEAKRELGRELARHRFPVGAARTFVSVFFGLLLSLLLYFGAQVALVSDAFPEQRTVGLVIASVLGLMVLCGFFVARWVVGRRPTEIVVHEGALVIRHGARDTVVSWDDVVALDQAVGRGGVSHVVVFRDGKKLAFGLGDPARSLARQIAAAARLQWIEEPFRAKKTP